MLFLTALLLSFCSLESWAYATQCDVESGNSAMGLVYVSTEDTEPADNAWANDKMDSNPDFAQEYESYDYYIFAKAAEGYKFVGWDAKQYVSSIVDASKAYTKITTPSFSPDPANFNSAYLIANFAPITYNFYFYKDLEATADEENVEYGESVNLPQYTNEGKTLLGWRNMEYGYYYEPTATFKADIVNEGKEVKLLALWDKPVPVKLNESGLATYSSAVDVVIATSGVKAYIGYPVDDVFLLTEIQGRIPAGTGFLLYGKPGTKVEFNYATEAVEAADIRYNSLLPTTLQNGDLAPLNRRTGDHYFALGTGAELLEYTGENFAPNRAYYYDEDYYAKSLNIVFDDATAIAPIATEKQQTATRKFIENGKLVIEKNGVKYNVMGIKK